MPKRPRAKETWESYFGEQQPPALLRLLKRQLAQERQHTEKLFQGIHRAINTEIGFMEQRIMDKFEEIDASLSMIAMELARRADDQPSRDAGF